MSRLIDADELLKDPYFMDETIPERMMFIEAVEDSPTAYDVDAVVREFEEGYESNVGKLKMISVDKAIEVVKRGGRNDCV